MYNKSVEKLSVNDSCLRSGGFDTHKWGCWELDKPTWQVVPVQLSGIWK